MKNEINEKIKKSRMLSFWCPLKLEELLSADAERQMTGYSTILKAIIIDYYERKGALKSDK